MDGNTIDLDPRTAEAMRQQKVYQEAMASLALEKRKKEASGVAIMAPVFMMNGALPETLKSAGADTKPSRMDGWVKFLLVALGGFSINYLFYAVAIQG